MEVIILVVTVLTLLQFCHSISAFLSQCWHVTCLMLTLVISTIVSHQ